MIINASVSIAEKGGLPDEYQQVEYIQQVAGTGQPHLVLTGIKIKATDNVYMKSYVPSASAAAYGRFFGALDDQQSWPQNCIKACAVALGSSTSKVELMRGGTSVNTSATVTNAIIHISVFSGVYTATISKETSTNYTIGNSTQSNIQDCVQDCFIFMQNIGARVYAFRITENGVTPRVNLIPCYRKNDSEVGMYDTVNDVFYTNDGTGTFIKGADV